MTALDPTKARRAAGHRYAEPGDDRLGLGQVNRILVMDRDRGLAEWRMARRAVRRHGAFHVSIDLIGWRCGSMAGRMPGLASWSLAVGLGKSLGKGCGLPLSRPAGLLQLQFEPFHLGA